MEIERISLVVLLVVRVNHVTTDMKTDVGPAKTVFSGWCLSGKPELGSITSLPI